MNESTTQISSLSNERVKQIRSLRDRKQRQACGLFFVEGLRIVGEALQLGAPVNHLVIARDLLTSDFGLELISQARSKNIPIIETNQVVFNSLSRKDGPQGIGAVMQQRWSELEETFLKPGGLWVALDSIQDPGNLGTILRTLVAVGGSGIILLDNCTDPYDPSALRASMGSIFSLSLVKASFEKFTAWRSALDYPVVGTSDKAEIDYQSQAYPNPMILLMGSERMGLQEKHYQICSSIVSIPMMGRSDSLNLSVATGIALYEIYNQRRRGLISPNQED